MSKVTYCLLDQTRKIRKRLKTNGTFTSLMEQGKNKIFISMFN
jgi:hypothetical protein